MDSFDAIKIREAISHEINETTAPILIHSEKQLKYDKSEGQSDFQFPNYDARSLAAENT